MNLVKNGDRTNDSGYVSNSIESNYLESSSIVSVDENALVSVQKRPQDYGLRNSSYFEGSDHDPPRQFGFSLTSTPFPEIGFQEETYLYSTPISRKRKSCWIPHSDSSFDYEHDSSHYITPSRSQKQTCTRKLWPDLSEGSISDTDLEAPSKKACLEGTRSEPNSPQRNELTLYSSPIKNMKLGSAEKTAMLYPNIRYRNGRTVKYNVCTPKKIRQRVREQLLKIKVTINPNQELLKSIRGASRVDFFTVFTKKSLHWNVIENILGYLSPKDLQAVFNVSPTARCCVTNFPGLNKARKLYLRQVLRNKENVHATKKVSQLENISENLSFSIGSLNLNNIKNNSMETNEKSNGNRKVNVSPTKREWLKFVEASADLLPGQKLTRCSRCSNPAKVVRDISICTRRSCQYIYCSKCCDQMCISVKYFENFKDLNNLPSTSDLLKTIPVCNSQTSRPFLAECSNLNFESVSEATTSKPIRPVSKTPFSSTFKMDIPNSDRKQQPKTINDLIEKKSAKTHSFKVKTRLFYTPESPPKINKPVAVSSEISRKNLRRLL